MSLTNLKNISNVNILLNVYSLWELSVINDTNYWNLSRNWWNRRWNVSWQNSKNQLSGVGCRKEKQIYLPSNGEKTCKILSQAWKQLAFGESNVFRGIYTMEYYLAIKKRILPFATVWMDLENIMLIEISRSEKDKYPRVSLKCVI